MPFLEHLKYKIQLIFFRKVGFKNSYDHILVKNLTSRHSSCVSVYTVLLYLG